MKNTILIFFLLLSISAFGQVHNVDWTRIDTTNGVSRLKKDTYSCPPPKWEIFYPGGWNGNKIVIRRNGKPDSVITKRKLHRL